MRGESLAPRGQLITAALMLLAACSIATADVMVRAAYDRGAEPMSLLAVRVAVAATLGWGYTLLTVRGRRARTRLTPTTVAALGLFAVLGLASQLGEIHALRTLPAALVVLMFSLTPVWIAIAGWALWREAVGRRGAAAVAAALVGTLIVVGVPAGNVDLRGAGIALGGGMTTAAAFLLYERRLHGWRPQVIHAIGMTVAVAVLMVADPRLFTNELEAGGTRSVLAIGSGVGFSLAILLVLSCIQRSSAFIASMATTSEPVWAAMIAWVALSEVLAAHQLAGGALALLGLGLAVGAALPSARRRPPPGPDRLT